MSWIITHQCRFQSRTGQQYCVNVSKQSDVSVEIKQLIGAETPFSTSEASGDDIFTPVRPQTGYLRVLDNSGGTLLEDLLPDNNTQKMVKLVNLTTGKTEWIGFMAAEVFTQPWDNDMTELEFPLRSALKCLEDVTIQTGVTGTNRLALLVYNAITSLFGEGQVPFTQLVFMDDFKNACTHMIMRANFSKFFSSETIMNDNTATVVRVGQTYKKAIEAMCQVFGITLREQGTTLIFGRYDNGGDFTVNVNTMDWSVLALISNSTSLPDIQPQGGIITKNILPIADFRNNNNKLSFIQGGREAVVTLNAGNFNGNILQMPESKITDEKVLSAPNVAYEVEWKTQTISTREIEPVKGDEPFLLQMQQDYYRGTETGESFYYYYRTVRRRDPGNYTAIHLELQATNRNLGGSAFTGENRYGIKAVIVFTTAVPCRWREREGELLRNGLLLVRDVWRTGDFLDPSGIALYEKCYSIISPYSMEIKNCFININFTNYPINSISRKLFYLPPNPTVEEYMYQWITAQNEEIEYSVLCKLQMGDNLYWNGTAWVNQDSTFRINFKGTEIVTNKNTLSEAEIEADSGWFVEAPNTTGQITFHILNIIYCDAKTEFKDIYGNEYPALPYQSIMCDLSIDMVYSREITSSDRGRNVYRKTIVESGFSDDKNKNLTIGTYNNNLPSPAFLRNSANTAYIQNLEYAAADGTTVSERPEMHLLNRMVEQYKTMRRTMTAKIATGIDLFRQRFAYNGRKFMAIDKKHDWEREEQEVKFIEVN